MNCLNKKILKTYLCKIIKKYQNDINNLNNKYLAIKKYAQYLLKRKNDNIIENKELELFLGDMDIMDLTIFKIVYPILMYYLLETKYPPPLLGIFILSLCPESMRITSKLEQLESIDKKIIYLFFVCLSNYITNNNTHSEILKEDYGKEILKCLKEWQEIIDRAD